MSLVPIRLWPDPVLTAPAAPVRRFDAELRQLAEDMLETMYAAPGRGLAAPQVGLALRLFVMDVDWKEGPANPRVIVNPELSDPSEETAVHDEGCLSLPGFTLPVTRPAEVTLRWQDLDGIEHSERLTGMAAICAQHEYDHLQGILTLDRAGPQARDAVREEIAALEGRG